MRPTGKQYAAAKANGGKWIKPESGLHLQVVNYMKKAHPKVLFHTDPAGELMNDSMRIRQARLNKKGFKMPDFQIMEARGGYHGLFIEIKKEETLIYNDKGLFKTEHLSKQYLSLVMLRDRGYKAEFGKGLQACIKLIDDYLNPLQSKG